MRVLNILLFVIGVAILVGCASMTCRTCGVKCEKKPGMFLLNKKAHPGWECPECGLVYDSADIEKQ